MITQIRKRDGHIAAFQPEKITLAIFKAAVAVGGDNWERAESLMRQVSEIADRRFAWRSRGGRRDPGHRCEKV
jgi:ribonucleoside-triphosphate reductase